MGDFFDKGGCDIIFYYRKKNVKVISIILKIMYIMYEFLMILDFLILKYI